MSATTRPRRAGRPRSPEVNAAILDAALRLLAAEGYARMTVDHVAAEAGVSKAAIYLRYRGKADLATAALAHLRETGEQPLTGDLRADLVEELRRLRRNTERVSAMPLVGTCLMEEQHTPELLPLFRERTSLPRRARLRSMLEARARRAARSPPTPTSSRPSTSSWARTSPATWPARPSRAGGRRGSSTPS